MQAGMACPLRTTLDTPDLHPLLHPLRRAVPACCPPHCSNYNTATSETSSKSYISIVSKAQLYMKVGGPHSSCPRS